MDVNQVVARSEQIFVRKCVLLPFPAEKRTNVLRTRTIRKDTQKGDAHHLALRSRKRAKSLVDVLVQFHLVLLVYNGGRFFFFFFLCWEIPMSFENKNEFCLVVFKNEQLISLLRREYLITFCELYFRRVYKAIKKSFASHSRIDRRAEGCRRKSTDFSP